MSDQTTWHRISASFLLFKYEIDFSFKWPIYIRHEQIFEVFLIAFLSTLQSQFFITGSDVVKLKLLTVKTDGTFFTSLKTPGISSLLDFIDSFSLLETCNNLCSRSIIAAAAIMSSSGNSYFANSSFRMVLEHKINITYIIRLIQRKFWLNRYWWRILKTKCVGNNFVILVAHLIC